MGTRTYRASKMCLFPTNNCLPCGFINMITKWKLCIVCHNWKAWLCLQYTDRMHRHYLWRGHLELCYYIIKICMNFSNTPKTSYCQPYCTICSEKFAYIFKLILFSRYTYYKSVNGLAVLYCHEKCSSCMCIPTSKITRYCSYGYNLSKP